MESLWESVSHWLKMLLIDGIVANLEGLFDSTNQQISQIAGEVGATPQMWNGRIFSMIRNLSDSVVLPIAGAILAFVMTLELIQMITDRNNMHEVDLWTIFRWMFKSIAAIYIVSNTWTIVMGIFDVGQKMVSAAAGFAGEEAAIDTSFLTLLPFRLALMDLGPLMGLWFQSLLVGICTWLITICIFIVIYGRMIEIYLMTSLAPIPFATMSNREWGQMGQNYLRSLIALALQAFLIVVCVAIYAVLVRGISTSEEIGSAMWTCMGYTILLCFSLMKTGSLAKTIFNTH